MWLTALLGGAPLAQEPTFAKRLSTKVLGAGNQSALARYHSDIRAHFRPFDDAEKARAIKKVKKCSGEWTFLVSISASAQVSLVRAWRVCACDCEVLIPVSLRRDGDEPHNRDA